MNKNAEARSASLLALASDYDAIPPFHWLRRSVNAGLSRMYPWVIAPAFVLRILMRLELAYYRRKGMIR